MAEKEDPKGKRPETNKQKSTESESFEPATAPTENPSIAERVKSSASGLLRNSISPSNPAAHSFGNDLSTALSSKPSASSSLPSSSNRLPVEDSFRSSSSRPPPSTTTDGESTGLTQESFRSSWTTASEADNQEKAWEQTFVDGASVNAILDQHDQFQSIGKGKGKGKGRLEDSDETAPSSLSTAQQDGSAKTVFDSAWNPPIPRPEPGLNYKTQGQDIQHPQDGSAVSDLLSDPSFQPLFLDDTSDLHSMLESDPFSTTANPTTKPITSTSLIPDVDSILSTLHHLPADARSDQITQSPGVSEWLEVDTQYQDVVWGYLKPYAEAAKKEVEEKTKAGDSDVAGGPAVRRLQMVLGHLKGKGIRPQVPV